MNFDKILCLTSVILGVLLMGVNLFGLTQSIRKPGLGKNDLDNLRFIPKHVWDYKKSFEAIEDLSTISDVQILVQKANKISNISLIHVEWEKVDPNQYRQLVPVWENFFLYAIGSFSGLPQFERYHYANFYRNIRRGIGICGDAATVLSSILDKYNIENQIVAFEGHVIVEAQIYRKKELFDPDFGVSLGISLAELLGNPGKVRVSYLKAGYSKEDVDYLLEIYNRKYKVFDSVYHFMSLRYIFEEISYVAKWVLPFFLVSIPFYRRFGRSITRKGVHALLKRNKVANS